MHPLWLFQPISHLNACKVLNLYGPFEIVMGPKICRASLIIGWIAYNYMEPSQNLLQIVFSKYGSTLVPRRERGYSQFSCYIDSALASTGYNKKNQAYQIYKENVWKFSMPKKYSRATLFHQKPLKRFFDKQWQPR